jgi:N6-adenosine-specific RNA methylase IME4
MTPLQNHPAADTFPMMEGVRFDELKADIQAQGQLEPITLCDGMILDGRNRYRACVVLGIEPKTRTYEGNPWAYAWSLNGNRRDLADMQRAACKILCDKGSEEYTKRNKERETAISNEANEKRRVAALEGRVGRASKKRDSLEVVHNELPLKADKNKGRAARAKEANVSSSTQARVESLANNRPDLLEKVASGEIKGAEALRQMKKDQVADKVAELPADKFSVIYADPPWSYNDKCGDAGVQSKQLGEHYPSMTMTELKALDVQSMAADNCVLWLWATCPLLEDALELCKAWGFKYKAQFVWDKVKHNMGHYNSVRHELLLICTKGSATPENVKLFDSVQSIERTEHSRKPEEFRDIINTLYPSGKKIELFRRGDAPEGWQTWGNEA